MAIDDAMSAIPGTGKNPSPPHGDRTTAQKNKSRKKAGQAGALTAKDMPDFIANITLPPYEQSMTAVPNDTAYLQPILPHLVEQLRLQDGSIGLGGVGAMIDGMGEEYYFDKSPAALKGLDLITLRAIQTIILTDVQRRAKTPQQIMRLVTDPSHINQVTSIYLPDFLKKIGYNKSHINKMAVEAILALLRTPFVLLQKPICKDLEASQARRRALRMASGERAGLMGGIPYVYGTIEFFLDGQPFLLTLAENHGIKNVEHFQRRSFNIEGARSRQ